MITCLVVAAACIVFFVYTISDQPPEAAAVSSPAHRADGEESISKTSAKPAAVASGIGQPDKHSDNRGAAAALGSSKSPAADTATNPAATPKSSGEADANSLASLISSSKSNGDNASGPGIRKRRHAERD